MKQIIILITCFFNFAIVAQTTISGRVTDQKNNPIQGANVYLKGTYDGGSTNENGHFNFSSSAQGTQTLMVSFISFETFSKTASIASFKNIKIKLHEDLNTLDAVIINAGTFEAGDNAKVTALKPLDIVTTASALGDIVGALQTLPGTTTVGEDGRLFVRGGDAAETQIFIDGIRVFSPYMPSARNIPTRGRFSPFLFKGTTFSTGGYSAEYGQALSGVLLLNTIDEPKEEKTELSIMSVGLGVGNTQIWGKNSFSINTSYINLTPYQKVFSDRNIWNKPVQVASGEMVYRHKFKTDGLLKVYGGFSHTEFDLIQDDINFENGFHFGLKSRNLYINSSYKQRLENNWIIFGGLSFTNDYANIAIVNDKVIDKENSVHTKFKLYKKFNNRFKLNFGLEYFSTDFKESYKGLETDNINFQFQNDLLASFIETDVFFSKKLASKIGVRATYSNFFNEFKLSPRISLAYKSGKNTQFSVAYGQFQQRPKKEYLKYTAKLFSENASHFIANYQYVKNKQILKIEAYYKGYDNLVKYDGDFPMYNSVFTNNGAGFAKGIDVFWRDNSTVKNLEYWLSYSYLDTQRDYKNYPTKARPNFASKHNASVVGKYWVGDWKSQLGLSYTFASGRTYTNPNKRGFLNQETKNYNSLSFNWAYLISQQKILYFSVNNVLGTQNVFGYNYKNQSNANAVFERQAIIPNADRFFFVGFFWTISDNKKDNQLNNL